MKASHVLSFAAGILLMLGASALNQSHAQSRHVFEPRMYTANPGKLDAVQARFRDHTDAILKRHNMKPRPPAGPDLYSVAPNLRSRSAVVLKRACCPSPPLLRVLCAAASGVKPRLFLTFTLAPLSASI